MLDETRARVAAELLEPKFIGTIGILLLAKRMGKIPHIRPLLDELQAKRFHLSDKVYRAVLDQAGE